MAGNFQPVFTKFSKGSYIFFEGKQSNGRFYLIREGSVQISRETDWETTERNVAGPGEMFGSVSAMASHSYLETAVALTDVVVMVLERSQYGDIIRKSNNIAVNTIKLFSQRLRKLGETLARQALHNTAVNDPSHLYQVGMFYEGVGKINQALYAYLRYLSYCPNAKDIDEAKRRIMLLKTRVAFSYPKYPPDTMVQAYPKDCLIFAEGETGNNLYIIQQGSIKISKIVDNQEVVLEVLGKNDIFGEMAMLEDKPRSATAEVYEDCTLLAVNRTNFTKLISDQPDLVVRMTIFMSERIWFLYKQLANTMIENPVGRIYDALLVQLEKNRVDLNSQESHVCNFGFNELAGMAGISENDSVELYKRIAVSNRITQIDDKLHICNVNTLYNEADHYRRAKKVTNAGAKP